MAVDDAAGKADGDHRHQGAAVLGVVVAGGGEQPFDAALAELLGVLEICLAWP